MNTQISFEQLSQLLDDHPDLFDRHPELLAKLALTHPQTGSAVSLLERQTLVLRDKIRSLEQRITEMVRFAQENDAIQQRLMGWVRGLLMVADPHDRAEMLPASLVEAFQVPSVGLGLWSGLTTEGTAPAWALTADHPAASICEGLRRPLCLASHLHQAQLAAGLLPEDALSSGGSVALLPLYQGLAPEASGILVLASPDPQRFTQDHGTEFLALLAELSSAALLAPRLGHDRPAA